MKKSVLVCVSVGTILSFFCATSRAEEPFETGFFKAVQGSWVGDGELTSAEGEAIPIHEEWKAEVTDEGTFRITGSRNMGENAQEFRWEYSFNPTTELYECEYEHTGMDNPLRFEVSLSEKTIELRTPFGDSGGELSVINTLTEDGLDGEVKIMDANGQENLGGTVKHKKKE